MRRRAGIGAVALLCAVALGGCTSDAAVQPTPPPPVATPTESAEERQERLDYAAAEKAYRTFRAEYGRVLRAGGAKEPTKVMKETAGGDYLRELAEVTEAYQGLGDHQLGREKVVYVRRGGYTPTEVELEVCEDSRRTKIVDRSGDVVGEGELRTASLQVRRVKGQWRVWAGKGKKVTSCE